MTDTSTRGGGQIVAIVDDDEAIRPALARLIRTFGYQARTFASAEALLVAVADLRADCVLTDIQMPGMNGLDLVKALRGRFPRLPIIVMTAYPSLANRELALSFGAIEYMTKPLDDARLEACLLRTIGNPVP
ncbi:MAG: response regulator [Devosia sp.]